MLLMQWYVILQVAVCNLASIALNMYVNPDKTYNFAKLKEVTKVLTRVLNLSISPFTVKWYE